MDKPISTRRGYPVTARKGSRLTHPEPIRTPGSVQPVFLPFAGCPSRCAFCNQRAVTGSQTHAPEHLLAAMTAELDELTARQAAPRELGFFGGTFTALPAPWPARFLDAAARFREGGLITRVRCSTRPDATAPELLADLKRRGLDLVELGIQSFHTATLARVNRGYDADTARAGCRNVRETGLGLGIQLMPGLPGQTPEEFLEDVAEAVRQGPECVRLYPCLVLRETELATMWERGEYAPWDLETTVSALAHALLQFWAADIPVIRMGLPPEPGLAGDILAGPQHPAIGQLARSLALFRFLRGHLLALPQPHTRLTAPARYRSDVLGHKRSMLPRWEELGLGEEKIEFCGEDWFEVR